MRPTYAVTVDGSAPNSAFGQRLLSLRLSETTGREADTLELHFDDRDNALTSPSKGASITISIGYIGVALIDKGVFVVDDVEMEGPPDTLIVHAKSADTRASLKAHKSRAWVDMTTAAIVAQIAGENGLTAQTDPTLGAIQVDHKDQTNESDLHFLTRLGKDHDAVATMKGGKLIFAPKGAATSASGLALGPLDLSRSDLTRWSGKDADRPKFGSVRAKWRDTGAAAMTYATSGTDEPVKTLRHVYPNLGLAQDAANAEHRRLKRAATTLTLELPGNPTAAAGSPVNVSGVRAGIDGAWIASDVVHDMDFAAAGYVVTISCTVNGLAADASDNGSSYGGDDADTGQDTTAEGAGDTEGSAPTP